MKKTLLFVLLALLTTSLASAAPLTVAWDPNPAAEAVTEYVVYVDGVAQAGPVAGGLTEKQLDLTPGAHTIEVTARNVWGESPKSVPLKVPGSASAPGGLRISVIVNVNVGSP